MKRVSLKLVIFALVFAFVFVLAACGEDKENDSHTTHAFGAWETVTPATCTQDGSRKRECVCGETETEPIAALGHSYGAWETEKEPTCTEKGLKKCKCSQCDDIKSEDIELISHNFIKQTGEEHIKTPGDCTTKPVYYESCALCGENSETTFEASSVVHSFGDWVVDKNATCTAKGARHRDCEKCDEVENEEIDLIPHKFTVEKVENTYLVSEATCTAQAVYKKSCSECGVGSDEDTFNHGQLKEHSFGEWSGDPAATCTTDGVDKRVCSVCKKEETKNVEAFGHNFVDGECENCHKKLGEGLKFALAEDGENLTVTGYEGTDTDLVIPEVWKDTDNVVRKVVAISDGALSGVRKIESLTIPKSVTSIGFGAMPKYDVKKLTIPFVGATLNGTENTNFGYIFGAKGENGVTYIPSALKEVVVTGGEKIARNAFDRCTFDSLIIKEGVTSVEGAFQMSKIGKLVIPSSVTSMQRGVFYRCEVTDLTIPFIGTAANATENTYLGYMFKGYFSNRAPEFPRDNEDVPKCLKTLTITGQTKVKKYALYGCAGITDLILGRYVTAEDHAFIGAGPVTYAKANATAAKKLTYTTLKTLVLTDGVVGDLKNFTALESVTLEEGIMYMSASAFEGCTALKEVTLPSTLCTIGESAFKGCTALKTVTVSSGEELRTIGASAFEGCGALESVALTSGLTEIGENAFLDCESLKKVNIDDVGAWFKIYFANIKANPTYYAGNLYKDGEIVTSAETPESVTSIRSYAFYNCKGLKNIKIGSGVQNIGVYAFFNCEGLTEITVPKSVQAIGESAFAGCNGLTKITLPFIGARLDNNNNDPNIPKTTHFGYIFGAKSPEGVILLPGQPEATETTSNSDCVPKSLREVEITGEKKIDDYAFAGCDNITKIVISGNVKEIGLYAFKYCEQLTSVSLPASVKHIWYSAFDSCSSLVETHISDLNAWVKVNFYNELSNPLVYANKLYLNGELVTSVTLPSDATELKRYAFYEYEALTEISISADVTKIGTMALKGCTALTKINYAGSVEQWQAIEKGENWDTDAGDYIVICDGGTVKKDGTVL